MSRIRVLVVDDTRMFREALCRYIELQPDMAVVGEAGDGAEGLAVARRERPDVVLMDIRMPVLDGVVATRQLKAEFPATHVITLTTFSDDDLIFEAIKAGAVGYLLKDMPASQLIEAIRAVQDGGVLIPPAIAAKLVAEFNRLATAEAGNGAPAHEGSAARKVDRSPLADLTPRETDILRLLAQGHSNKEIAEQLFLTEGTVKNYVSTIRSKLHARDRGQAIAMALRMGLVD